MKRAAIIAALLFSVASTANAATHWQYNYYDTIRPHGHKRSAAIGDAAINACFQSTGQNRFAKEGPAFKKCMAGKGYRYESAKLIHDPGRAPAHPVTPSAGDGWATQENNAYTGQQEGWQQQNQAAEDMQSSIDAANAGYDQAAAQTAQDASNAASFAAQMTVGN